MEQQQEHRHHDAALPPDGTSAATGPLRG